MTDGETGALRPPVPSRSSVRLHAPPVDEAVILGALGAAVLVVRGDGIITNANPQACKILRARTDALLGESIESVLAPLEELLQSIVAGSGARRDARVPMAVSPPRADPRGEIAVRFRDGTSVELGFSVSQIRVDDVVHHVLLFQEISGLLELRRQRDRLLQIAAIGEMMPTVLHELRNPLAAVTTMLEVLSEDAAPDLQKDLHTILWEVRRMALGLQGLSGLVRSMHSSAHSAIDLAVREACRLLETTAHERNVTLRSTGPDMPLLPIDRSAVAGVVFNLVKNAVEACREGGNITVDARVIEGELVLTVSDDGVGMAPEVLSHARELFFTTKAAGSGVGLALCHEVAEASGGALSIDSSPGAGTTVVIRVPLQAPRRTP